MTVHLSAQEVAAKVRDGDTIAVNSSSGLCCPDHVLEAIGQRYKNEGHPGNLTTVHPIAAGDMFGTPGVDHLASPGQITTIIGGSYPSGPSSAEPPEIWKRILNNDVAAYNIPSGVIFDMLREAAGKRPGVLTKVGIGTFVDPDHEGCAMNEAAREHAVVERRVFNNENWLYFQPIAPDVAIIRASVADEKGNLAFDQEGAYLGAMEMALAAHNSGGMVIAQVKRIARSGTLKPHTVRVPGVLVDYVVEAPEQLQTTATSYDPAISGELFRPDQDFSVPEHGIGKILARRVAQELQPGWAVNIGFGISANVPRILLEEGQHGSITWVIEQGAVGGIPLLDFKFGCSANAEAFVASPHQFAYFQAGGFDAALLSFLEIGADGSVNVSKLGVCPHRTAGAGGFVDITTRAKKIVFSGYFNAGAKISIRNGQLSIDKEGRIAKLVPVVEQISFSGEQAIRKQQDITYITERCVIKLREDGLVVTEIAPGIRLQEDILDLTEVPLKVADNIKTMDERLFLEAPIRLWQNRSH